MRERVGLLGGEMSVVSKPGLGTTVRAEIPWIETGR
jgi:signal transduction histidine kinase